jgi:diacylglycerol kinase family enzyme
VLRTKAYDKAGREVDSIERKTLLFAFGASGHRTYGSGQRILPDGDNACTVFQIPLSKKLVFKNKVMAGEHRGLDILKLFAADRLVFEYDRKILLQRDGEVDELTPADFPLAFELTEPAYNVLEPVS